MFALPHWLVLRGSASRPDANVAEALREYELARSERDQLSEQLAQAEAKLRMLQESASEIGLALQQQQQQQQQQAAGLDAPQQEVPGDSDEGRELLTIAADDPSVPLPLRRYIQRLQVRVEDFERKEQQAQRSWLEADKVLNRTVMQFAAGGIAGAVARSTVAPIDRVKILMQTQHITHPGRTHYNGVVGTLRTILREEGVARLWRGNVTNVVRVVPYAATQFAAYDFCKEKMLQRNQEGLWAFGLGQGSAQETAQLTTVQRLVAGAFAGMAATTITHPLDVIRLRLNVQPELRNSWDAIRSISQEGLARGMFKGYFPTVLSLSPFIAINFATFDQLQSLAAPYIEGKPNPMVTLTLGGLAGIFAQTCCFPLDTVRRRMQLKGRPYRNTLDAFRTIAKEEGVAGFYKGMVPNMVKVLPNNAIRFLVFTQLKQWWGLTGGKGKGGE